MKNNTNQNAQFNGLYEIKIKIIKNFEGNNFSINNLIVTPYYAHSKTQTLKQTIYLLSNVFNDLRQYPLIFDVNIDIEEQYIGKKSIKNILEKARKRFVDKIKNYEEELILNTEIDFNYF